MIVIFLVTVLLNIQGERFAEDISLGKNINIFKQNLSKTYQIEQDEYGEEFYFTRNGSLAFIAYTDTNGLVYAIDVYSNDVKTKYINEPIVGKNLRDLNSIGIKSDLYLNSDNSMELFMDPKIEIKDEETKKEIMLILYFNLNRNLWDVVDKNGKYNDFSGDETLTYYRVKSVE